MPKTYKVYISRTFDRKAVQCATIEITAESHEEVNKKVIALDQDTIDWEEVRGLTNIEVDAIERIEDENQDL